MKKKIIVILTGLLFLSVTYNIWWVSFERQGNRYTIEELNKGAEIDYHYVNAMADFSIDQYNVWQSCNSTLSKELSGDISDNDLEKIVMDYSKQVESLELKRLSLQKMKEERSEAFSEFKYIEVYKPDFNN